MKKLKRISFLILLLLLGSLLFACNEKEKSYEEALSYYAAGEYQNAVDTYLLAISQGEESAVIYADLSLAYQRLGEKEKAESAMQRAFAIEENSDVVYRKGLSLTFTKSYRDAASFFERAISLAEDKKKTYPIHASLADAYYQLQEYDAAIGQYNALINASYEVMAHSMLCGRVYLSEHQFSAAEQYFDKAMKQKEFSPEAALWIRSACIEAEAFSLAEKYFFAGEALLREGVVTSGYSLGEYYFIGGKYQTAMEELEKASTPRDLFAKGQCLLRLEKYEEAAVAFENAILAGMESASVYERLMTAYVLCGKTAEARQIFTKVLSYDDPPTMKEAYWNEIRILEQEGAYTEAEEKLAEYRKRYPGEERANREKIFLEQITP